MDFDESLAVGGDVAFGNCDSDAHVQQDLLDCCKAWSRSGALKYLVTTCLS